MYRNISKMLLVSLNRHETEYLSVREMTNPEFVKQIRFLTLVLHD